MEGGKENGWRATYATCCFLPQRVILGIMGFLAVINAYTMRICLSVAITEMVVRRNRTKDIANPTICKPSDVVGPSAKAGTGTYTWSEETIGIILSSFYWGYIITHLPGGLLADKLGGKYTLSLGLLSSAIFTLGTPSSVKYGGAYSLIVLRVLLGLSEGSLMPALSTLLADWMPLKERSFWGAVVLGAAQAGTIVANSVSGLLISYFETWEVVFYIFGICGVLWFLLFAGTGTYTWSEETIGIILSSFYWGYIITHLPGGLLADKLGGKYTLSLGLLSSAIFTLGTPSSVKYGGAYSLIVLRVLLGLSEGSLMPALSTLLADWMPLKERSFWGAVVLGAAQAGTIVANSVSGLLISYFETWEVVFYIFGICGVLWFLLFTVLCYSDPSSHPCISIEEKSYLEEQLGTLQRDRSYPSPPWKFILTSAPFWALIVGQIGHDWGLFVMVTYLPKYMADVLLFPIKESGLYSALPYFLMWCNSIISAILSDYIIHHQILSITAIRKIYTFIAAVGPGIFMVLASKAGCNRTLVIALFTIGMMLMGFFYPSLKVNPIDLSPHYAGTLQAIANGLGAIAGIVSPYMVGLLTPNASLDEWAVVFWVTFSILTASAIIYSIWASGLTQPWDDPRNLQ